MLWNTLIKRVDKFTIENPGHEGSKMIRDIARTLGMDQGIYLNTIRPEYAQHLRKVIPDAFPKKLQRLPLKVSKNIHGKWRVDATNKEQP